jgi:tetratricopeptide (TPR) repeat protein
VANSKWRFCTRQAGELFDQGHDFGDPSAFLAAIDIHASLLPRMTSSPLDWATTQHALGNALWQLGNLERGTARLKQAVEAFEAALTVRTLDHTPREWGATQNSLGAVLSTIGANEDTTVSLERALVAFRKGLQVRTRSDSPREWGITMNNVGLTLRLLGERDDDTNRLREATEALTAALEVRTRIAAPREWAMTSHNLGIVFFRISEAEGGTELLERAERLFLETLDVRRGRPLDYAATKNMLGNVLRLRGQRTNDHSIIEKAIKSYLAAITEWTRDRAPLQWAMVQNNLGEAYLSINRPEEALGAFRESLLERTKERTALDWGVRAASV